MAFGTDESVLFMEVSLIQRCPYREVPLYMCTVCDGELDMATGGVKSVESAKCMKRYNMYIYILVFSMLYKCVYDVVFVCGCAFV